MAHRYIFSGISLNNIDSILGHLATCVELQRLTHSARGQYIGRSKTLYIDLSEPLSAESINYLNQMGYIPNTDGFSAN